MDGKFQAPTGRIIPFRKKTPANDDSLMAEESQFRPSLKLTLVEPRSKNAIPLHVVPKVDGGENAVMSARGLLGQVGRTLVKQGVIIALVPVFILLTPAWLHEQSERPSVARVEAVSAIKQWSFEEKAYAASRIDEVAPDPVFVEPAVVVRESPALTTKPSRNRRPISVLDQVFQIVKRHAPKKVDARVLARAIVDESRRQNYDPLFVAAVIKSESTFNVMAKSHVGARGLMQIMPATGKWLAEKFDEKTLGKKGSLTDTGYNLKLGITYLKHLEELYGGDRVFTLVAYNWGPGRVERAFGGRNRVPGEVAKYAIKILNDHRRWESESHAAVSERL